MGRQKFREADGLAGQTLQCRRPACEDQRLVHRAGLQHEVEAPRDPLAQKRALGREHDLHRPGFIDQRLRQGPIPFRPALPQLQRTGHTLRICGADTRRRRRILLHEQGMQPLRPFLLHPRAPAHANLFRHLRNLIEAAQKCPKIESRSPTEDGHEPFRPQTRQKLRNLPRPLAYGVRPGGITMAVEDVRNAFHLLLARARGEDRKSIINLHGIGVDHRAAISTGKPHREGGFAARRRSGYQDRGRSILTHQGFPDLMFVATLISARNDPRVNRTLAREAADRIGDADIHWLEEGVACDIATPEAIAPKVRESLHILARAEAVDCVVQEASDRRKSLLLADMDSTMIGQECIDELAAELGLKGAVAEITARAMNGEIAFEPALRERVALLKDLPEETIARVIETRITLTEGGRELVATMRANGAYTALVSGGFTAFTTVIAQKLGFDENRANILQVADGKLDGTVAEPILGAEAKLQALRAIAADKGLTPADALAVGDGANDLPMIMAAGTGVALHAKPKVAAEAPHRVDHGDLTALLFLQGYRAKDFRA